MTSNLINITYLLVNIINHHNIIKEVIFCHLHNIKRKKKLCYNYCSLYKADY